MRCSRKWARAVLFHTGTGSWLETHTHSIHSTGTLTRPRGEAQYNVSHPKHPEEGKSSFECSHYITFSWKGFNKCFVTQRIKVYPKSLSVSDMMKPGKIIKTKAITLIELRSFDLDPVGWSLTATTVEFNIEKDPFRKGGFREAYR